MNTTVAFRSSLNFTLMIEDACEEFYSAMSGPHEEGASPAGLQQWLAAYAFFMPIPPKRLSWGESEAEGILVNLPATLSMNCPSWKPRLQCETLHLN